MAVVFTEAEAAIQNSDALYGRYCAVTIGDQKYTGNRVTFKVQKTYRKNPNPAEIVVYNLTQTQRNATTQRGTVIRLDAGYVGAASVLYVGEIVGFNHKREGTDWVSTFQCRDGDKAWLTYTSRSYASGTPRLTIVRDLAADMGFAVNSDAATLIDAYGSTRAGIVTHGHAFIEMDEVLKPLGLSWSIQDGQLQVTEAGGSTSEPAVLLNSRTGLILVPQRMEEYHKPNSKKKGRPFQVKAQSLLQAAIRPGRQVKLESDELTGYYTCLNVTHSGDTHGNDWQTEAELQGVYGG
jgi:hypothetical protein